MLPVAWNYWSFLVIYVFVISFAFNMGFLHAMHAVANLWFVRYRTRVLSIFSSSLRFGSALLTPVVFIISSPRMAGVGAPYSPGPLCSR